jgi:hypothetical protein
MNCVLFIPRARTSGMLHYVRFRLISFTCPGFLFYGFCSGRDVGPCADRAVRCLQIKREFRHVSGVIPPGMAAPGVAPWSVADG